MASDSESVFISYRRDESAGYAGRIADSFDEYFGEDKVFRDIDSLEPGLDFSEAIERALESSEVLVAVIGKNWLTATDAAGQRRLENPDDLVRVEIATALKRNIRVIPLLVQGASMPSADEVPEDLAPLTRRNAFEIHDTSWKYDIRRLITAIERVIKGTSAATPDDPEAKRPAEQKPHKEEPSPPQGQDSSDSTLREGAQQGHLVAPRPRWAQIGVAVLLAGMITTIPQLIWWLATGVPPSPPFVFGILHPLTLLCGLWAGLAWPGRHPKGLTVLGSFAGLLDLVINWSIAMAVMLRNWWTDVWWYITPLDFLSAIGIAALFTAGGLFGDLIESWRLPRRREEESEVLRVVRGIAQKAFGPRRQPSETTLKLVQALGPSILALLGLIIAVITQRY